MSEHLGLHLLIRYQITWNSAVRIICSLISFRHLLVPTFTLLSISMARWSFRFSKSSSLWQYPRFYAKPTQNDIRQSTQSSLILSMFQTGTPHNSSPNFPSARPLLEISFYKTTRACCYCLSISPTKPGMKGLLPSWYIGIIGVQSHDSLFLRQIAITTRFMFRLPLLKKSTSLRLVNMKKRKQMRLQSRLMVSVRGGCLLYEEFLTANTDKKNR